MIHLNHKTFGHMTHILIRGVSSNGPCALLKSSILWRWPESVRVSNMFQLPLLKPVVFWSCLHSCQLRHHHTNCLWGNRHCGIEKDSVPMCTPMVFMIVIPPKWLYGYNWGYSPFSDIPRRQWRLVNVLEPRPG